MLKFASSNGEALTRRTDSDDKTVADVDDGNAKAEVAAVAAQSMSHQVCRVCNEPAAGFHFGAFTCEGCKSFFGRTCNAQTPVITECKNDWMCTINKRNRTACKACRLRKCLTVGMSKSGSRYGRRSNWFKIHCLMQSRGDGAPISPPLPTATRALHRQVGPVCRKPVASPPPPPPVTTTEMEDVAKAESAPADATASSFNADLALIQLQQQQQQQQFATNLYVAVLAQSYLAHLQQQQQQQLLQQQQQQQEEEQTVLPKQHLSVGGKFSGATFSISALLTDDEAAKDDSVDSGISNSSSNNNAANINSNNNSVLIDINRNRVDDDMCLNNSSPVSGG